ncbi:MAG: restriction endonuclease subunit R, partial [Nostoc sp.]
MVQTLAAENVTLEQLILLYGLELVDSEEFFREWQDELPEVTNLEKQLLDQIKAGYINLRNYPPLLENTVNT